MDYFFVAPNEKIYHRTSYGIEGILLVIVVIALAIAIHYLIKIFRKKK